MVDKQEGIGGNSGHFTTFSAGFCVANRKESSGQLSSDLIVKLGKLGLKKGESIPEHYAGPGAPRPF